MAGFGFPYPFTDYIGLGSLPGESPDPEAFIGPRLRRVCESVERLMQLGPFFPGFHVLFARELEKSYDAAVGDGEEFLQQNEYTKAFRCFNYTLNMVQHKTLADLDLLVDLSYKVSFCLWKLGSFPKAYEKAQDCVKVKPDFLKGYTIQSKILQEGHGIRVLPAAILMSALERCKLKDSEQVDLIVEASQLLAAYAQDVANGKDVPFEERGIEFCSRTSEAKLPQAKAVWDQIFQTLYTSKDFEAMALLTVGLPSCNVSQLRSCACDVDFDCSKMEVEMLYETVTLSDIEIWGDRLAVFILDHNGGVGRQTEDPLAVHLVRMTLKSKSLVLLQYVLRTREADAVSINQTSLDGDTALHIVVKSLPLTRLHQRIVVLLLKHGATKDVADKEGKTPDECVDRTSVIYKLLHGQVVDGLEELMGSLSVHQTTKQQPPAEASQQQSEDRPTPIVAVERLKAEGKEALQMQDFDRALKCYKQAVTELERNDPSRFPRELAVLYCNMAIVYSKKGNADDVCTMARKSLEYDPTYHKPYWYLGKVLLDRGQHREACEELLRGASCRELNAEQKSSFLVEISRALPSLSEKQAESIVDRMQPMLSPCWPKIVENLTRDALWVPMGRLVLGPPYLLVSKSDVPAGWKYADRYEDSSGAKVGYAMSLKATTHNLSTLTSVVDEGTDPEVSDFATDLVLALLLQGAKLETLASREDGSSCYHAALSLCCSTEKVGLMRYILSDSANMKKAQIVTDEDKRTLLHSVCLYFGDGEHTVGQELARLLMEKGFDPSSRDMFQKRAGDYLAPESAMLKILLGTAPSCKTADELGHEGNTLFKKKKYQEAIDAFSQAICKLSAALPSSADAHSLMGLDEELHRLAVLLSNRSECHLQLGDSEKALADAKESVNWDGHWHKGHFRVGRAQMAQKKYQQASKAFVNAFNALGRDSKETQKLEVLKELARCLSQVSDAPSPDIPNLHSVDKELWVKVIYSLFCEGNKKAEQYKLTDLDPLLCWKAGRFAFDVAFPNPNNLAAIPLPEIKLDLKPLCSWLTHPDMLDPLAALIIILLMHGSDHKSLTFYEGDTYVHAALCFSIRMHMMTLLNCVMESFALRRGEQNLQDKNGNTVLHVVAYPAYPPFHAQLDTVSRYNIAKELLQLGVHPHIRNKQGKQAVECLAADDHESLRTLLETATRNATPIDCRSSERGKGKNSSRRKKSRAPQSASPEMPGSASSSSSKKKASDAMKCDTCAEILLDVRLALNSRSEEVLEKLATVLSCTHEKNTANTSLTSEAADLSVKELCKSSRPDIPDILLRAPASYIWQILQKLAAQDKWHQLETVVDRALAKNISLGQFAKSVSIKALVSSQTLLGAELRRVKILDQLVTYGAELAGNQGRDALKVALQNGEFTVAQRLVKLGADPRLVTFDPGDSPLQAALTVALDKDPGNFTLFQQLLSMFEGNKEKYPFLDPQKHCENLQAQIENAGSTKAAETAKTLLLPFSAA